MNGEKRMWKYLAPKLRKHGHFERIESHETAIGTPDVEYCIGGYTNRLELKYTNSEKRGFRLRPAQAGWFRKRVKAGGQPWLLAQSDVDGKRGFVLVAGTDVPPLISTTRITDWLKAGIMVWEDKIIIEELMEFLSFYLMVDSSTSAGQDKEGSSRLILPSYMQKTE